MDLCTVLKAAVFASDKPVSGYDLTVLLKDKSGNAHQQVYRALNRLAARGELTVTPAPQIGKPDRRLYSLPVGRTVVYDSVNASDFRKTPVAYSLLAQDLLMGRERHARYVEAMQKAEREFLEREGVL